jgi:hypothetical protein
VVSLAQLRGLGITDRAVRSRVAAGHLHPVHRGVYAVGHGGLAREGRWMAAVLACGDSSALSHRSGAALLDLRHSSRRVADVTVSGRRARSRPGIDAHAAALLRRDVVTVAGIPCTSWARTLLDLGAILAADDLARAVERAQILRLFDLGGAPRRHPSRARASRGRQPSPGAVLVPA